MTTKKVSFSPFQHRRQPTVHWKSSKEMHRAMRGLPGPSRAVLLELLEHPLTRHEIRETLHRLGRGETHGRKVGKAQLNLETDLARAQELGFLEEREGRYVLTEAGREAAEHMQEVIPAFMGWAFSPETASLLSIWVHAILSVLKLVFGLLSRSAGLFADGIDNAVDTLSAFLVWLGIKYDKEKLVSIFIVITMFVSVGGVALATYDKVAHLRPITDGLVAFAVSALCGLIMLGVSSYQYLVGKRQSNLAILCQAVDARNHFLTSLLVCAGILLSFLAGIWGALWLHYADAVASAVIGVLILKGALELMRELFKPADDEAEVSHFMKRTLERRKEKIIFNWLRGHLHRAPLTREELEQRFIADFCKETPKILILSGMGYRPASGADLAGYLERFVGSRKLVVDDGRYWLVARS
jgi:divalent metal cation (Fe/Co/Zn/Cd) transporter